MSAVKNFYQIILNSGLSVDQPTLLQALKQKGADTIQTSNGLFSACEFTENEFRELVQTIAQGSGVEIRKIHSDSTAADLTPDVRAFMQKSQ